MDMTRIKNATPGTTRRGEDTLREENAEVRGLGERTNRPAHIAELIDALEIVDLPSLARALLGK